MSPRDKKRFWTGMVAFLALALAIMFSAISTQNYALKAGDISPETILAPRDTVDEEATAELKQQARDSVSPIYLLDSTILEQAKNENRNFFEGLKRAKSTANSYALSMGFITVENYENVLTQEQVKNILESLSVPIEAPLLYPALLLSDAGLDEAMQATESLLVAAMEKGLKEEDVTASLAAAIQAVQGDHTLGETQRNLAAAALTQCVRTNMTLDQAATNAAIQAAEDAVSPVEYKKGQAIAREGDVLTERQILVLTGLGMMEGSINIGPYLSILFALLLCAGIYLFFGYNFERDLVRPDRKDLIVLVIVLVYLLLCALVCRTEMRILSVALVSLTVTLTYSPKSGIVLGSLFGALVTALGYGAGVETQILLPFFVGNLFCAFVSSIAVARFRMRSGTVLAALFGGLACASVYLVVGLAASDSFQRIATAMGWALGGALISGVICLGTMPIWESLFGLITPMKLMELCNPSSPLLKRLSLEAPGTYHHSVMVANLAEAAADAVGADPFIAWAGAYYHDVGKLMNPAYFSENQLGGVNPHDELTPEESCAIIARHTHDGARILREPGLPKVMVDIALSHHGDSLMLFFANKAKELYGPDINMKKYCHTGKKPRTKEEAVVMLADGVEAATRSNPANLEKVINGIIKGKLSEGQLSLAPLTFQDLAEITDAFLGVLKGVYHTRVAYPNVQASELMEDGKGERS